MKRFSRTLILAGLSLATVAMAAQDGVVLKRTLKENATEVYKMDSKVTQTVTLPNGMGDQEVNVNSLSTYKLTTGKLDAEGGKIPVTVENTVDKFDVDGPAAGQTPQPKPVKLTGTLDAHGHVTMDLSGVTMNQAQSGAGQTSSSGMFVEFPDTPVKVGDSWDINIPKSLFTGSTDQKLTAKLVGEKKVGDMDVWVVSLSGSIKIDIDSSKLKKEEADPSNPMAGQDIHVTGVSDIASECLVDKATGRTVKSEAKSKTKGQVEIVSMGLTVDIVMNSTTVTTLQP